MKKAQRGRKFGTLLERNLFLWGVNSSCWWSDVLWGWNEKMVFSFGLFIRWGVDFLLGGDVAPPCLFTK